MFFTFILFLTLGLAVFIPLQERSRNAAGIIFLVLMVLWLIDAGTGFTAGWKFPR